MVDKAEIRNALKVAEKTKKEMKSKVKKWTADFVKENGREPTLDDKQTDSAKSVWDSYAVAAQSVEDLKEELERLAIRPVAEVQCELAALDIRKQKNKAAVKQWTAEFKKEHNRDPVKEDKTGNPESKAIWDEYGKAANEHKKITAELAVSLKAQADGFFDKKEEEKEDARKVEAMKPPPPTEHPSNPVTQAEGARPEEEPSEEFPEPQAGASEDDIRTPSPVDSSDDEEEQRAEEARQKEAEKRHRAEMMAKARTWKSTFGSTSRVII
jgi:hypothetical protein